MKATAIERYQQYKPNKVVDDKVNAILSTAENGM